MAAPGASAASLAAERERAAARAGRWRKAEAAAATDRIAELESTSGRLDSELADTRDGARADAGAIWRRCAAS